MAFALASVALALSLILAATLARPQIDEHMKDMKETWQTFMFPM